MKDYNLLPADTFVVINKTILNDNDRIILTMLYQPIIGSGAVSLYFTLWAYLDKLKLLSTEKTHHHLLATIRDSLENVKMNRKKLEGIGLLKTYIEEKSVNSYIYELYSPLNPYEFLSSPILATALYSNVGKIEYEAIVNYFKIPKVNLKNYENITCSFTEVFTQTEKLPLELLSSDIKRHQYRNLELISKLNIEEIFSKIPEELLNFKSVTNETKELIYKLSFIYNLDEFNTVEIVKNSINEDLMLDIDLLQKNCHNFFQFEKEGKLPSIAYKEQPIYIRKQDKGTSPRDKMIHIFETTKPAQFLASITKTPHLTKNDKDILSSLLIDFNLNPGVVNVLIDYVLKINNNKLIKNFIEVIAAQWKRSKIETVQQAMDFAEKEYKKTQKFKVKKTNKKEIVPEWFDQKIESKKMDKEKLEALEAMLKEYK